jgi:hypothetical protein
MIVGIVAGVGTTFAAVPDRIAMVKRGSCARMDARMAAGTGALQIVSVYYGVLTATRPAILRNLSAGAYFYFARRDKPGSP